MDKPNQKKVYEIKELNDLIKNIVMSVLNTEIYVKGEISNLKMSNDHTYLTLKDSESSISAVSWKKISNIKIQNGLQVIINGKLTWFIKSGTYQISINKVESTGVGDIYQQYNDLKTKFEEKGLFNKKRPLPENISRVGIVSSIEGAVWQDIQYVLKANNFVGNVIIKNCSVQGPQCTPTVVSAIKYFEEEHKKTPFDILIIARGGGSFEDLMGYNSEDINNAIYDCPIITISAVGHQTDFMLSDYTSDIRAPTPSIAAELISSQQATIRKNIINNKTQLERMKTTISARIDMYENNINILNQQLNDNDPIKLIDQKISKMKSSKEDIYKNIVRKFEEYENILEKLYNKQDNYNYKQILEKGYNIIVTDDGNAVMTKEMFIEYINSKRKLKIIFVDGELCINDIIQSND